MSVDGASSVPQGCMIGIEEVANRCSEEVVLAGSVGAMHGSHEVTLTFLAVRWRSYGST